MSSVVKVTGSILVLPSGAASGGASGEIDLGTWGPGDSFEDVRQREDWRLATLGPLGQRFVAFEIPAQLAQLWICSRDQSDVAIRLNGEPASVASAPFDPTKLIDGDSFTLSVDQAPAARVSLTSSERSWDALITKINAAAGQRVAGRADGGAIRIAGGITGDMTARDRGWQHGSIELGGSPSTLAKLGLAPGLTFGTGTDLVIRRRFLLEPPLNGANAIHTLELSGSAELVTHVAGF